jgi:hypothetical protein
MRRKAQPRGAVSACKFGEKLTPMEEPAPQHKGAPMSVRTHALIEKIQALPPARITEVEDFVDFIVLREREGALTRVAAAASAPAFAAVWDNPGDDAYDAL